MSTSPIRSLLVLVLGILMLLALLLLLLLTDTLLNIQQNLQEAPDWVSYAVMAVFGLFLLLSALIFRRVTKPRHRLSTEAAPAPTDEASINMRMATARADAIPIQAAENELAALRGRQTAGEIHISVFGEISSGKSSLIQALLPNIELQTAVTGGTTRSLDIYRWVSPAGDQLILTDMPGTNESQGNLDTLAQQEAIRSHLVIYVCDGDLTASQNQELQQLLALNKPIVVALNKTDQLSNEAREQIIRRLQDRLKNQTVRAIVPANAKTTQKVLRINTSGDEESVLREVAANVAALQTAIQRVLDADATVLDQLRDSAVFSLVAEHLDQAERSHRQQQAEQLTTLYSKKAVIGAIAAMTPGTDLLIQGYLATQLIKDLTALYGVPARQIDIDLLLKLVQKYVNKHYTLIMAVAGNALKAFPGAGTVAGGLLHAVAYGYLFNALGRGVAGALHTRGELHPLQAADLIEEQLSEAIGSSAKHYAQLALKEIASKPKK